MEFIINSENPGIDFTRYSAYVDSVRDKLPAHIFAFASDIRHFNFDSHSSLHDSWLKTLELREAASPARTGIRTLEINLCLLGAFHDREIHLRYIGVTQYRFDFSHKDGKPIAHGDLFTHEIRLGREHLLIHELLFHHATILIECEDIRHSEEMNAFGAGE